MSRTVPWILLGLVLGAAGTAILLKYTNVEDYLEGSGTEPEEAAEGAGAPSFIQQDAEGQTLLRLDPNLQARMGLKTASLCAAEVPVEAKVLGRVLDPAPLASLVAEAASAQAKLQTSAKELERIKVLYSQDRNASGRDLEAAETAVNQDRIQCESVQARLWLDWGKAIATQEDLPTFVRCLVTQGSSLIRVDLPLGEDLIAAPTEGRVASAGTPEKRTVAVVLGPAPSVDPQMQGHGYLLLAKAEPLPPGTAVIGWLTVPGKPLAGVQVPEAAILRHQGRAWVYLSLEEDAFGRRPVTLNHPIEGGWLITDELTPGRRIVVDGAQLLLSEELKSTISLDE